MFLLHSEPEKDMLNINISHRAHPTVHGFGSVYARDDSFRAADDETAVAVPLLFAVL